MEVGTLTPPAGERTDLNADGEDFYVFLSFEDIEAAVDILLVIMTELQLLMEKADDFQNRLACCLGQLEREHLSALVQAFLSASEPLFTSRESRGWSRLSPQPLVLSYADQALLSLDESQWNSLSPLYTGQCQIDRLKVSTFRYYAVIPFVTGGGSQPGLYKRMRWNVERIETEFFFLCFEEIYEGEEAGISGEGLSPGTMATRMWSIGRWLQTFPDPDTEDILEWVLCEIPKARYLKLVSLGSEEPSVCHATDCLLGVLFPQLIYSE
ncbi:hypothetical protein NHX12_018253 [Muraenolepis orangiensis]|uniref:Uncharacterized protein n=1 Tax=Muraenolepis orangiensis TaxID=630683 RepID=A0A9Q0IV77_9TELE|nr:hypothetical protein NHX12_018253 [Muraenolepis orangiensis]